jgi:hypothetical protein
VQERKEGMRDKREMRTNRRNRRKGGHKEGKEDK